MNQFDYSRPSSTDNALSALAKDTSSYFLAGGTNLIDMMKMGIVQTGRLVDITALPLKAITETGDGIRIGALVTNSDAAEHPLIKARFPLLSQALLAGASPQLRNMATTGGNLMQRTRCPYFFDLQMPCNKRAPGTGCGALEGYNRMHAVFGASKQCIAVNPSDMNVALATMDARVLVTGAKGSRSIPIADFHRLPGDHPELDNTLKKGELITAVEIPNQPAADHTAYLKVRDRTSYAFALVSAAVQLQLEEGIIKNARIAMGGLAHKPWRMPAVEQALQGREANEQTFKQATAIAMDGAKAYAYNAFKLKLAPNTLLQCLKTASGLA